MSRRFTGLDTQVVSAGLCTKELKRFLDHVQILTSCILKLSSISAAFPPKKASPVNSSIDCACGWLHESSQEAIGGVTPPEDDRSELITPIRARCSIGRFGFRPAFLCTLREGRLLDESAINGNLVWLVIHHLIAMISFYIGPFDTDCPRVASWLAASRRDHPIGHFGRFGRFPTEFSLRTIRPERDI